MLKELSFNSIGDLDIGEGEETLKKLLRRLAGDCCDRFDVKKPRVLTVKFKLCPVKVDSTESHLAVSMSFDSKVPAQETMDFSMKAKIMDDENAAVMFDDNSPEDVDQMALADEVGRKDGDADVQ